MSKGNDEIAKLFHDIYGFVFFQGLVSACELGLFDFLSKNPGATVDQIAKGLSLPGPSARALVLGAAYLDYVKRDASGACSNAPITEKYLVSSSKDSVLPLVVSNNRIQYRALYHMPEALKAGENLGLQEHKAPGKTLYERLANTPADEAIFHDAMECFTRHTIQLLADVEVLKHAKHILDVGGGTGQTARGLCSMNKAGKVTIFDSESITALAKKEMEKAGLSERVDTCVGDFLKDPFPKGVDTILFSHVIEIYSEEQVQTLIKKSFDVLDKGGKVVIWGTVANENETGGGIAAKISLYFLTLASGVGYCYPASDYERWFKEAGFSKVTTQSGIAWEHGLIVAEK